MQNVKKITSDIYWVGASDRRIELFENVYPVPDGVSYNSYVIIDEKTCLMDGVDESVTRQFLENLDHALQGRTLDYMVVQHMEPDHCAAIPVLLAKYPGLKIVASAKAVQMISSFFHIDAGAMVIKEGDELSLGRHNLKFVSAPMVHWPEVMVTYDEAEGILFSADAFGSFGALGGNIFADEVDWERDVLDEARRYYVNIVGKYGAPVTALLKKASALDIKMILPLHGYVWRNSLDVITGLYLKWASYTPEKNSAAVFYGSIYGNTANAAEILAGKLADRGLTDVRVYDVSKTDVSELLSAAFEYSALVFASATYNGEIFDNMNTFLTDIKKHGLTGRVVGIIENGSWAATAGKKMSELIGSMKNMDIAEPAVTVTSSVDEKALFALGELADAICAKIKAGDKERS